MKTEKDREKCIKTAIKVEKLSPTPETTVGGESIVYDKV
jgi:hypothetical protein